MPEDQFGGFVAAVPPPLGIGTVTLDNGETGQVLYLRALRHRRQRHRNHPLRRMAGLPRIIQILNRSHRKIALSAAVQYRRLESTPRCRPDEPATLRRRARSCLSSAVPLPLPALAQKPTFTVGWSIYAGWTPYHYMQKSGILKKWADKYGITIKVQRFDYAPSLDAFVGTQHRRLHHDQHGGARHAGGLWRAHHRHPDRRLFQRQRRAAGARRPADEGSRRARKCCWSRKRSRNISSTAP